MTEHWSPFWKQAPEKDLEGELVIASSTDTQESVNRASRTQGRNDRGDDDRLIYTQVVKGEQEADGGTEHNEVQTYVNGKRVYPDTHLTEELPRLSPEGEAVSQAQYRSTMLGVRAILPDVDEALSDDVEIPPALLHAITSMGLGNGPQVSYYLGKHRAELSQFEGLTDGQVRRKILDLAVRLSTSGTEVGADSLPTPAVIFVGRVPGDLRSHHSLYHASNSASFAGVCVFLAQAQKSSKVSKRSSFTEFLAGLSAFFDCPCSRGASMETNGIAERRWRSSLRFMARKSITEPARTQ
jgi:hypothetical protein